MSPAVARGRVTYARGHAGMGDAEMTPASNTSRVMSPLVLTVIPSRDCARSPTSIIPPPPPPLDRHSFPSPRVATFISFLLIRLHRTKSLLVVSRVKSPNSSCQVSILLLRRLTPARRACLSFVRGHDLAIVPRFWLLYYIVSYPGSRLLDPHVSCPLRLSFIDPPLTSRVFSKLPFPFILSSSGVFVCLQLDSIVSDGLS